MIFPSLTLGLLDTLECGLFPAWCSFCIVDQPCSFHYGHRQATPTLSYRDWLGAWIPKMVHTSLFLQSCWAVSLCSCMTWKPNSTSECWLSTWPGPRRQLPLTASGWHISILMPNLNLIQTHYCSLFFLSGRINSAFISPSILFHLLLPLSFPSYIKQMLIKWLLYVVLHCIKIDSIIYPYAKRIKISHAEKNEVSQT